MRDPNYPDEMRIDKKLIVAKGRLIASQPRRSANRVNCRARDRLCGDDFATAVVTRNR